MSNPMKKYEVEVIRRYYVCDSITVYADNERSAVDAAEDISGDKDYSGSLQLEDVEVEIYSEEEDDRK